MSEAAEDVWELPSVFARSISRPVICFVGTSLT
jgi:hypothetical protein